MLSWKRYEILIQYQEQDLSIINSYQSQILSLEQSEFLMMSIMYLTWFWKCWVTWAQRYSLTFPICCCLYDRKCWLGIIMEVCLENLDSKIHFMYPHFPTTTFRSPSCDDTCYLMYIYVVLWLSLSSDLRQPGNIIL